LALLFLNALLISSIRSGGDRQSFDGGQDNLLVPILALMIGITLFRTTIHSYQMFERSAKTHSLCRQDMYRKLQELDFDSSTIPGSGISWPG
jgi:ATP-binding cassette subfamily B protein